MTDGFSKEIRQDNFRRGKVSQQSQAHGTLNERRRGRPAGAKNKPKGLLQAHVAEQMLGILRPLLPPAEYEEIKEAIKKGKSISTLKEVKIMLALMSPPIWQRLIQEAQVGNQQPSELDELGQEPKQIEFYKDTNERIKVWNNLATLAAKLEGEIDEGTDTQSQPLAEQFKKRGLVAERFIITGSVGPGSVGGDSDGLGWGTPDPRTVSNQLPARQVEPEDSEEIEATGILDIDRYRDDSRSDNEAKLQR